MVVGGWEAAFVLKNDILFVGSQTDFVFVEDVMLRLCLKAVV